VPFVRLKRSGFSFFASVALLAASAANNAVLPLIGPKLATTRFYNTETDAFEFPFSA
jgi:hypothetical protein